MVFIVEIKVWDTVGETYFWEVYADKAYTFWEDADKAIPADRKVRGLTYQFRVRELALA